MNVFITSGTYDFLKTIKAKHANETMILMENAEGAVLLHETSASTVFESPRKFEVIDSSGELAEHGHVVFNNIPVTEEGRPIFEYRFKNRARAIEDVDGFQAIRVLRPLNADTYIILTQWKDEAAFKGWQNSKAYDKAHQKRGTEDGIDNQPKIFSSPSYVSSYNVPEED
ncbi:heme-degrading monooxygenase HmoA [Bacillus ectoiniformans]|uniref:antibiotic biosynthesis monooxygenase family protein n=1 Tax=Bacillus ectoiniformans TaxID=1494429 RepID=UPI0019590D31|nr:antibiotic biosynthesis monooxygenase [Bacillus ectoiniformans]MBM7647605.1 heme-degrading monooxygenase HmoA [Bacillus ectoiniformans]